MNLMAWLIVGGLAGWIATLIAHPPARQGWAMSLVVGVVGALVGGLAYSLATGLDFVGTFNVFDVTTLLVATLGAVLLLVLYQVVARRPASS